MMPPPFQQQHPSHDLMGLINMSARLPSQQPQLGPSAARFNQPICDLYSEERTNAYDPEESYYAHNIKLDRDMVRDILKDHEQLFTVCDNKAKTKWHAFRDINYKREKPLKEKKLRDDVMNRIVPVEMVPKELAAIKAQLAKKHPYAEFAMDLGGNSLLVYPGYGTKYSVVTFYYKKKENGKTLDEPKCSLFIKEYPIKGLKSQALARLRLYEYVMSKQEEEGKEPDITDALPTQKNDPIIDDIGKEPDTFSLY